MYKDDIWMISELSDFGHVMMVSTEKNAQVLAEEGGVIVFFAQLAPIEDD